MCYGDPWYGRDGYALKMLEAQMEEELQKRQDAEEHWRISNDC